MKKTLFIAFFIIIHSVTVVAQGTWTWKWGNLSATSYSSSGIGVFSPSNSPGPGRYAGSCWNDNNGKFWLYGDNNSDLWQYDPSINQWALMHASGILNYGTQGVPASTNHPGTAAFGNPAWTDNTGSVGFYKFSGNCK